jgi:hypothetical protein
LDQSQFDLSSPTASWDKGLCDFDLAVRHFLEQDGNTLIAFEAAD